MNATVLLVHGSWHGSWCWARVVPLLRQRGLTVKTLDLPSCGRSGAPLADLDGDAESVRAALERIEGPVLLCAHSYGGAPASAGAVGNPHVVRIVYLAAFMLDAGESCAGLRASGELPAWCAVADDGTFSIDPDAARWVLYGDCDPSTQGWASSRLVPQNVATSTQTLRAAAWHATPSSYVRCTLDRALPPDIQRRLAARAGEELDLTSSHSPFLSQPDRVAAILAERAQC